MKEIEENLNRGFDWVLDQISHGNTIEGLIKGRVWYGLEQVKEWKSKFGYQFHIYSNDHFIDKKPHFHILNQSESIDCKLFFDGVIIECKGQSKLSKKVHKAVKYFISDSKRQHLLIDLWNNKNPSLQVRI
jgi:hypothetical protein